MLFRSHHRHACVFLDCTLMQRKQNMHTWPQCTNTHKHTPRTHLWSEFLWKGATAHTNCHARVQTRKHNSMLRGRLVNEACNMEERKMKRREGGREIDPSKERRNIERGRTNVSESFTVLIRLLSPILIWVLFPLFV